MVMEVKRKVCNCEVCRRLDALESKTRRDQWFSDLKEVHAIYMHRLKRGGLA